MVATPPVVEPRAYLTVKATPATAQVRIMNISPAYRDGIELTPGDFDLEVSALGYQIKFGAPGGQGNMPGFADTLSDEQVLEILRQRQEP